MITVGVVDGGNWAACFGMCLLDLQAAHPGMRVIRRTSGPMGLADARNAIVAEFLAGSGAALLFIDTDMAFPADLPERLASHERPFVGALCHAYMHGTPGPLHTETQTAQPTTYRFTSAGPEYGVRPVTPGPEELCPVDATGAACTLVRRAVYETVGSDWYAPIHGEYGSYGEDLSFCVRVRQAGIPIVVDTGTRILHHKSAYI